MELRPYTETLGLLMEANAGLMLDHIKAGSLAKAHKRLTKLRVSAETRIEWWSSAARSL